MREITPSYAEELIEQARRVDFLMAEVITEYSGNELFDTYVRGGKASLDIWVPEQYLGGHNTEHTPIERVAAYQAAVCDKFNSTSFSRDTGLKMEYNDNAQAVLALYEDGKFQGDLTLGYQASDLPSNSDIRAMNSFLTAALGEETAQKYKDFTKNAQSADAGNWEVVYYLSHMEEILLPPKECQNATNDYLLLTKGEIQKLGIDGTFEQMADICDRASEDFFNGSKISQSLGLALVHEDNGITMLKGGAQASELGVYVEHNGVRLSMYDPENLRNEVLTALVESVADKIAETDDSKYFDKEAFTAQVAEQLIDDYAYMEKNEETYTAFAGDYHYIRAAQDYIRDGTINDTLTAEAEISKSEVRKQKENGNTKE